MIAYPKHIHRCSRHWPPRLCKWAVQNCSDFWMNGHSFELEGKMQAVKSQLENVPPWMQTTKICQLAICGSLSIHLLEFSLLYQMVEKQRRRRFLETLRGWGDLAEHREEGRNSRSAGKDVSSVIILRIPKLDKIFFFPESLVIN